MANAKVLAKKTEEYLMREYHDLVIISKMIETAKKSRQKNTELSDKEINFINEIYNRINKEGRIEKKCERLVEKLEKTIKRFSKDFPEDAKELQKVLSELELIKRNQLTFLYQNKKLGSKKDLDEMETVVNQALNIIPSQYHELDSIKSNVIEMLENNKSKKQDVSFPNNVVVLKYEDLNSDQRTMTYVLKLLRSLYAPKLVREIKQGHINDIEFIRENGFGVQLSGQVPTQNYALFLDVGSKITKMPPIIRIRCEAFQGGHAGGMHGRESITIFAGIISKSGNQISSEWITKVAPNGSPQYDFGLVINRCFLKKFKLI